MKKWIGVGLLLFFVAALSSGKPTATTTTSKVPTITTQAKDPAQEYRSYAAGQMILRVSSLTDRAIAQCRRVRLAPVGCEQSIRDASTKVLWNIVDVSADEARFMAFSERVQQFERTVEPILQKLEHSQ